ncbi:MAG: gamma-glutamylcyclotransferase family protein [Polyangiales bacterium]
MKTFLTFAYGSNLDEEQMRARCGAVTREARATLCGHALTFGGFSHRWNGSVASVRRARGSEVAGLLYALDAEALRELDRFEGHPFAYERVVRYVVDEHGRRRRAQVYIQPEEGFEPWLPGPEYLAVMARAYRRLGFDRRPLAEAALGGSS